MSKAQNADYDLDLLFHSQRADADQIQKMDEVSNAAHRYAQIVLDYQLWTGKVREDLIYQLPEGWEAFKKVILENAPDCADRTSAVLKGTKAALMATIPANIHFAIRLLREARMDANSAIALKGKMRKDAN